MDTTTQGGSTPDRSTPPRRAFTVREVADALSVNAKQVYSLIADDRLRHFRVGKHIRIPVEALDEFLADAAA